MSNRHWGIFRFTLMHFLLVNQNPTHSKSVILQESYDLGRSLLLDYPMEVFFCSIFFYLNVKSMSELPPLGFTNKDTDKASHKSGKYYSPNRPCCIFSPMTFNLVLWLNIYQNVYSKHKKKKEEQNWNTYQNCVIFSASLTPCI